MDEYTALLQYKELLDEGIITEEEFEKKKRELLFAQDIAEEENRKKIYAEAKARLNTRTSESYSEALSLFKQLGEWEDAADQAAACSDELKIITAQEAEEKEKLEKYNRALLNMMKNTVPTHKSAIADLEALGDWKDAAAYLERAKKECEELEARAEEEAKAAQAKAEAEAAKRKQRKDFFAKKSTKAGIVGICVLIVAAIVFFSYVQPKVIKPMQDYNHAVELLEKGEIIEAKKIFKQLGDYKDSAQQIDNCEVALGDRNLSNGKYEEALKIYEKYKDNPNVTDAKITKCKQGIYDNAVQLFNTGKYPGARSIFLSLDDFSDSKEYVKKCDEEIEKERKEAEKAAKEAEEKKAGEEQKKREDSPIVGTWYAKRITNYLGNDMTDEMGDLSYYYITFNSDGTGVFSVGEERDTPSFGGKKDFTWKIEDTGVGNGSIGTWTLNGDTDDIFFYDDHVLVSTERMESIFYDMNFFCFK